MGLGTGQLVQLVSLLKSVQCMLHICDNSPSSVLRMTSLQGTSIDFIDGMPDSYSATVDSTHTPCLVALP